MDKLESILIRPNFELTRALRQLNESGEKILFVTGDDRTLLGVVTDGDIRRWILKNNNMNISVEEVMNKEPIFIYEGFEKEKAQELLVANRIDCIPVVDKDKKIISAIWWIDLFEKEFREKKQISLPVVIMAGGMGSRLTPFTKILPKPLIPINDKPIIERIIDNFVEYGCRDFYVSIYYMANIIKAYFSDFKHDYKLQYIQEDKPLGTAGSLYLLKDAIKDTFFVTNCDILIDADYADILRFHRENKHEITIIGSTKSYTIPYGVCETETSGRLKRIKEKPEYGLLVNTGMYLLEADVLNEIPKDRFHHITDLINDYLIKGKRVGVYPILEKSWLDVGELEQLQAALKKFGVS